MSSLLLALAFAGAFGFQEKGLSDEPDLSIAVVADGTPGWQKLRAEEILDGLCARFRASRPVLVAWFGFAAR